MDLNIYQARALKLANPTVLADPNECYNNAVLGLLGEAGEIADLFKKHLYQGHPHDEAKFILELGDLCWYISLFCSAGQINLGMFGNVLDPAPEPASAKVLSSSDRVQVSVALNRLTGILGEAVSSKEVPLGQVVETIAAILDLVRFMAESYQVSFEQVLLRNLEKLEARYPEGFNSAHSLQRAGG